MKEVFDAYGYEDVAVAPGSVQFYPRDVETATNITSNIRIAGPFIGAEGPHVSPDFAVRLASNGGVAIISGRKPIEKQVEEIREVKRRQNIVIYDPYIVPPDMPLEQAVRFMEERKISGVLVAHRDKILLGILTNRDVRFAQEGAAREQKLLVRDVMKIDLVTGWPKISLEEAKEILRQHKKEKLPLVDQMGYTAGLITIKDMENLENLPYASRDRWGRLRVGGGIELTRDCEERAAELIEAGADFLSLVFSHADTRDVALTLRHLKSMSDMVELMVGNVANGDLAKTLRDAGADAVVVGVGSSSVGMNGRISGSEFMQITAIMVVVDALEDSIPVIAAGGIRFPGYVTKAICAGASAVKIGAVFAGVKESAAKKISYGGMEYREYTGSDFAAAFHQDIRQYTDGNTLVPEGFDAMVPYSGEMDLVYEQYQGGFKQGMARAGCRTVEELRKNGEFLRVRSQASRRDGVVLTREAKDLALLRESS